MADKKFSELETASEIKNSDFMAISQDTGNGKVSLKATILAIATKILTAINFTSALQTTDKTVIGAINEVAQGGGGGGSSTLDGLNDVDIDDTTLADGQALVYDENEEKWVNGQGGGGTGGHTIIDENGNSMTARAGLQFIGANVSDDSTNNKTIVDMSGGGVYIEKTLWEDANGLQFAPNNIQTITLSESLNKYDFIYVDVSALADTGYHNQNILAVSSLYDENDGYNGVVCIGGDINRASSFAKVDNTHLKFIGFSSANPLIVWKVVGIKVSGDYYAPVIYSTEEREIGVWTDGKPLYQKTFGFSASYGGSWNNYNHQIANIDNIITCNAGLVTDGTLYELPQYRDSGMSIVIGATATQIQYINSWIGTDLNPYIVVTLQYTKTTDTAGSGSWTPQGVPTHHYSTDEHIIGTWIDGKTLYEKTISSDLTLSTASWQNYTSLANLNLLSVDKVIITRDGEQVPMAFSPYMIVAWIVRDNYLKFIIQSSTSVAETIVLKSCTIQYTKSS